MDDCYDDLGTIKGARCERCGHDVPVCERERYEETGMCGWCAHMAAKDKSDYTAAPAMKPGDYYVIENVLEERLAPSNKGIVTNRIYRGQKIEVFELRNGWARVSRYYDGSVEGQSGQVARWVLAAALSTKQPEEKGHAARQG